MAEILTCNRLFASLYFINIAYANNLAAMYTCARADINNAVGSVHSIFIMLNNYNRIAKVTKSFKRTQKFFIISLMKSYARLVKNIKHAHKTAANLSGKSYTLTFTAAECTCRASECEIA